MTKTITKEYSWTTNKSRLVKVAPYDMVVEGHYEEKVIPYDGSLDSFLKVFCTNHTKYEKKVFLKGEEVFVPAKWEEEIKVSTTETYILEDFEDDILIF